MTDLFQREPENCFQNHDRLHLIGHSKCPGCGLLLDEVFSGELSASASDPVIVDDCIYPFRNMMMCHMMSKSLDNLHAMADEIGIQRKWFQNKKGGTPHYDISKSKRALAVKAGAVEVGRNEIVEVIRFFRKLREGSK